ncbi:HI1506-related protein [Azospirillum sp. HJ39]|uniref:HI1506-related protein n=1 Tax=Azospirillum sp. HJ39 TaxID=3159496 RepID=UPI003558669E
MEKDLLIAARPAEGFRRCGVHHPPAEVRHRAGTFTEDEVKALKAERNLIVMEADPEAAEEGAGKASSTRSGSKKKGADPKPDDPTPDGTGA